MPPPSSSPGVLSRFVNALSGKLGSKDSPKNAQDRLARLGLNERQQELNALWGVYRNNQYAARKIGWDGKEATNRQDSDVISTQGFIPPGFMDQGKVSAGSALPLKFRRPSAPYALVKVIVDRFTGLLFSENRHPEIKVDGDPVTQDWLRALADATRVWQNMIQARTFGGAMGSVAVGFQFIEGKPVIEVHDPRWCTPAFTEHGSTVMRSLEKRYIYPKEERDPTTGRWETKLYWYRRTIDETSDVLYQPAPVDEGDEPQWVEAKRADHHFSFCPVIWVQNLPLQDSEDGDPDCAPAVYDNVEAIDALIAQANRGIIANCDPTIVITSKAEMAGSISVGSDNAIRVPEGDAKFLELQASGPKAAMELAGQLREHVLEMTSCVLEHPDVAGKTATEVSRNYEAMFAKSDVLREQYGQKCVVPLFEMMWRAANELAKPRLLEQGQQPADAIQEAVGQQAFAPGQPAGAPDVHPQDPGGSGAPGQEPMDGSMNANPAIVRGTVLLPSRYERGEGGVQIEVKRELGTGGTISLKWPGYLQMGPQDLQLAVTAAAAALSGGLVDDETAITYVAPFFKAEDVAGLVEKVRNNAAQAQADLMSQMQSAVDPNDPAAGGAPPAPPEF